MVAEKLLDLDEVFKEAVRAHEVDLRLRIQIFTFFHV